VKSFVLSLLTAVLLAVPARADFITTGNPVHPGGTRATVDIPGDQHIRNIGGSDGAGLCVGTSNEVAGRWQNLGELAGFQKWLSKRPGGSYPEMLEKDLKTFASSKGVAVPRHVQHTGGDVEFLRRAVKTRRMTSITYGGHDNFYGEQGIAHMVNCAHLDGKLGAIIDNNEPTNWRWMNDTQLVNRWLGKRDNGQPIYVYDRFGRAFEVGGGWAVVWLTAPPPPIDTTARSYLPESSAPANMLEDEPIPEPIQPNPERPDLRPERNFLDRNFGIDGGHFKPKMRYWVDGVECDRHEAMRIVVGADDVLTDDSEKPYLSFVVDDKALRAKLEAAVAPYSGKIHVNFYTPDSWVVKTRLSAKVTAQLPYSQGGKAVFRGESLTEADAVVAAKKALGIVDPVIPPPDKPVVPKPDTDPKQPDKSPDAKPDSQPQPQPATPTNIPLWLVALAGLILYLLGKKGS